RLSLLLLPSLYALQHPQAMRKQKQEHHTSLLFIPSSLIISFSVVLLHDLPAHAALAQSCFASTNQGSICSSGTVDVSFPFLTSDECHDIESSFIITNCDISNAYPNWPGFSKDATKAASPLHASVVNMYSPLPLPGNLSYPSDLPFDTGYGYIALTWNPSLLGRNACGTLASYEQISQDIPQSINLRDFAHSAFNFHNSTIILLFRCNATKANTTSNLQMSSIACMAYGKECNQNKDEGYNCYQYMIPNKELNLLQVMNASGCKQTMFFVAVDPSLIVLSTWKPGILLLIWNPTGTNWLASTFQDCVKCTSRNGSCGYDRLGNFTCSCATICSSENPQITALPAGSPTSPAAPQGCSGVLSCNAGRIWIEVGIGVGSAVLIIFTLCWIAKAKLFKKPEAITSKPEPDLENLTERPIEMSYSSLVSATSNFMNTLGQGGFGIVYRGSLIAGVQIAVKVMEVASEHTKTHFLNEVATIGRIHHVHLVRLLGFCVKKQHRVLVYEYVKNGSLDKWLFCNHRDDPAMFLHWRQRYNIALGIAKGLGYLHEECRYRIIHCDIKPQNILLDEHLCPKIADFGLAKLMARDESSVATLARGTPGYMAPEFWLAGKGQMSTKFDVYSYGMVLLELISGHRNFENGSGFPGEAFDAAIKGDIQSIIDVKLDITMPLDEKLAVSKTMEDWQDVRRALFVALWCIQDHPTNRPHMSEVVLYLEGKVAIDENPPCPAIASILLSLGRQQSCQSNQRDLHITPMSGHWNDSSN
ncbi:hypothetical protein GOP47_0009091, partial [Adiantum capillus-veneris]